MRGAVLRATLYFLMTVTSVATAYYILQYAYVSGYLEKRKPYRPGHLALLKEYYDQDVIVASGLTGRPTSPYGSMFLFNVTSGEALKKLWVNHDPYIANNLVTKWQIFEWTIGIGAFNGTHPAGLIYPATYYLLELEAVSNFLKVRQPYQMAHRALVARLYNQHVIVAAGELGRPTSPYGGLQLMNVTSGEEAKKLFVDKDPYVPHGVVKKSTILQWTLSVGALNGTHPSFPTSS